MNGSNGTDGPSGNNAATIAEQVLMIFLTGTIVVGPIIPYGCQYFEIIRTKNGKGLSLYYCLMVLNSSILRIMFWFGKHFDIALLVQSIVVVVCIMALIDISMRIERRQRSPPSEITLWDGSSIRDFWQWTTTSSYFIVVFVYFLLLLVVTYILIGVSFYIEGVGFLSLVSEGVTGAPQVYKNWKRKSTYGLSAAMVIILLLGDGLKFFFFIAKAQPVQFYVCGTLQVSIDLIIFLQVLYYSCCAKHCANGTVITNKYVPIPLAESPDEDGSITLID